MIILPFRRPGAGLGLGCVNHVTKPGMPLKWPPDTGFQVVAACKRNTGLTRGGCSLRCLALALARQRHKPGRAQRGLAPLGGVQPFRQNQLLVVLARADGHNQTPSRL